MKTETLPLLPRQLIGMTLLIALPMLVAAAGMLLFPHSRAIKRTDVWMAAALLLAMVVLAGAVLGAMTRRRSISLDGAVLTVRASFYTARLDRAMLTAVAVERAEHARDLPVCIRTNGVAAFGYLAGWFSGSRGERCFCAVGAMPAFVFRFDRGAPVPLLILSCSAAMAAAIEHWIKEACP